MALRPTLATKGKLILEIVLISAFCLPAIFAKQDDGRKVTPHCTYFENRHPRPEPNLQNCSWFRKNSCCTQKELDEIFNTMEPLQHVSQNCHKQLLYLMCYICSPVQNYFYFRQRLLVCEDFCDQLYTSCTAAEIRGRKIGELYNNGGEFCRSRRFTIGNRSNDDENKKCFGMDPKWEINAAFKNKSSLLIFVLSFLVCISSTFYPTFNTDKCVEKTVKLSTSFRNNDSRKPRGKLKNQTMVTALGDRLSYYRIFAVVLFILSLFQMVRPVYGSVLVNEKDVKEWADAIAEALDIFSKEGLKYSELQRFYDTAKYSTEKFDGYKQTEDVKRKLGLFFQKKKEKVLRLAYDLAKLYDVWVQSQIKSSVTNVENFPSGIFVDADNVNHFPNNSLKYSKVFKQDVAFSISAVKIPERVLRNNTEVISTVAWSVHLERSFIDNSMQDPDIRWQYFGSKSGILRLYPGWLWKVNFAGFPEDFDPRTRHWYAATSEPHDVIIILDASTSMAEKNSFDRAKRATKAILDTLTYRDNVNIVVSRSEYWDSKGNHKPFKSEVLSCSKEKVVPVSDSRRKELQQQIDKLVPDGGSDHREGFELAFNILRKSVTTSCQSIVIFITDGLSRDATQRCGEGRYIHNADDKRQFTPGGLCEYDFADLLEKVNLLKSSFAQKINIFSVITSEKHDFPKDFGCSNYGSDILLAHDIDLIKQLRPYFAYMEEKSRRPSFQWTPPYWDEGSQGLVITATVAVYSNLTSEFLGVVAVDISLETVENLILNDLWGSVYAFMIDNEGLAVLHTRLRPSNELVGAPIFVPISHLEQDNNGEPKEFNQVLRKMLDKETGSMLITHDAKQAYTFNYIEGTIVWRHITQSHYFFTPIEGTDFSLAFNFAPSDENYRHPTQIPEDKDSLPSYLHEFTGYGNLSDRLPKVLHILTPQIDGDYPGILISKAHSTVLLAPRSFCDANQYLQNEKPSLSENHIYINGEEPLISQLCMTPGTVYKPSVRFLMHCRPDVKITALIEQEWKSRESPYVDRILWTYVGTNSGVFRIYPGTQMRKTYDPTRQPWYNQALINRGNLAVSSVYLDVSRGQKMKKTVTFARTIHQGKPEDITRNCSDLKREDGCPCDYNENCMSEYCYDSSCANSVVHGVMGLDMIYETFQDWIYNITMTFGSGKAYCGQEYPCPDKGTCTIRCYLIDESGNIVLNPDFYLMNEDDMEKYQHYPLAKVEGPLFADLVDKGVFVSSSNINYQGFCNKFSNQPTNIAKSLSEKLLHQENDEDDSFGGPFPGFQSKISCVQDIVYYHRNLKNLENKKYIISGHLKGGKAACSSGTYFLTNVKETNLYFLVIKDHKVKKNVFNINCEISSRVLAPGSYPFINSTCPDYDLHFYRARTFGTCSEKVNITACPIHSGSNWPHSVWVSAIAMVFIVVSVL